MPLYLVSETDAADRLIEATSQSAALRHAARPRFSARSIGNPSEVAKLMADGVQLENATTTEE